MPRICVTGSDGLIGRTLVRALLDAGIEVVGIDMSPALEVTARLDVTDRNGVAKRIEGCDGIIHLAAVSRVIWGEQNPAHCNRINVLGTQNVIHNALVSRSRPWLLFASSREVYGQATDLPVREDAPLLPVNAYGRSKVAGERLVAAARMQGICAATVRLSNVYGSVDDYPDRVVPAFARAANFGASMRLDGPDCTFDFTHVDDVVRGLLAIAELLSSGDRNLPSMHFVTGRQTSLCDLAGLASRIAGRQARIVLAAARGYDAMHFCGDPALAFRLLGWRARVTLEDGITSMVAGFNRHASDGLRADNMVRGPVSGTT